MNNNKVSVIVPVYNAGKCISRCIESILTQTYTNFELLLIDDGSTDNSPQICDAYASTDSRISVIHKQNGGVSSARNTGLEIASGDYIFFVDADDYCNPSCIYELVMISADIVIGSTIKYGRYNATYIYDEIILDKKQEISLFLEGHLYDQPLRTPWGKLYKAKLIKDNNIQFNSKMHVGEDTLFMHEYLLICQSVAFAPKSLYYYLAPNSDCKYLLNPLQYHYLISQLTNAYNKLSQKFCFTNEEYIIGINAFCYRLFANYVKSRSNSLTYSSFKEVASLINTELCLKETTLNRYLTLTLYLIKYKFYRFCYYISRYLFPLIDSCCHWNSVQ